MSIPQSSIIIFYNENLIYNILSYLPLKDTISFSFTSKEIYSLIHNPNNKFTNFKWFKQCEKILYDNLSKDFHYSTIINFPNYKWKYIYMFITSTKNELISFLGKENADFIIEAFFYHQYLPKLRKTNNTLENLFISLHQNYYFEKEISSFNQNTILNEDDAFNEIVCLIENLKLSNMNVINILHNFSEYNFISVFLIIIIKITKLVCVFHINRLNYIKDVLPYKEFLNEYIEIYNSFVQSALTINDKYIKTFNYSIYEIMFHIWKNEVYYKIDKDLNKSIIYIIPSFINELLSHNNNDDDYYNFYNEISNKEIIEKFANCLLDFSINKNNIRYINHTEIPLLKEYIQFENIVSQTIINSLISNSNIKHNIIEKIEKCINDSINFISHTKLTILNNMVSSYKEYLINNIENDFNLFIDLTNTPSSTEINIINDYCLNINNEKIKTKFQEEIDMICCYLCQNLIKLNKGNIPFEKVISFINGKNIYVDFLKKLIYIYYERLLQFESINEDVVINNNNDKNISVSNYKEIETEQGLLIKII